MKKGNWAFDNIGMLLIALLVLIVAILFIMAMKGRGYEIIEKFKELIWLEWETIGKLILVLVVIIALYFVVIEINTIKEIFMRLFKIWIKKVLS